MDTAGKRIEVLLEWRDLVVAAGHPAPTVADMMRIGASGEVRPDGIDLGAVEPWAATIEHLLRQLQFSVAAPLSQIPDDLRDPAPETFGATTTRLSGPLDRPRWTDDTVMTALRAWWQDERRSDPALRGLKEHHLRTIVSTGSRTEAEIRRLLPSPLVGHARRIAEVIAQASATTGAPAAAVPRAPVPSDATPGFGDTADGVGPAQSWPTAMPSPTRPVSPSAPSDPPPAPRAVDPAAAPSTGPASAPPAPRGGPAASTWGAPPRPSVPDVDPALAALELSDHEGTEPVTDDPLRIITRSGPHGTLLKWPRVESTERTVLYRLVSVDETYPPDAPQDADPVVVTEERSHLDDRPFSGPVRYVQVWVHAGADPAAAAAAEPTLHAQAVVIAQVTDVSIREDGHSVVGNWRVPAGVACVQVSRVPAVRARRDGHAGIQFRLKPLRPFVDGFVDDEAQPGERYVYELSVEVELEPHGPLYQSDPVKVPFARAAVLTAVTDLRIRERSDDTSKVDLSWTRPPGGTVRIHRTRDEPAAGVDARPVPVTSLPKARLTAETNIGRPILDNPDGTSTMPDVPWLEGWTFAYLTPVTVIEDMAAVGRSQLAVHLGTVDEAKIVERTHRQILTFAWPQGADSVLAYVGGPGQGATDALRYQPVEEISRRQYDAQGGLYLRSPLPSGGCSVHLQPVAHAGARRITGSIATVAYPGLRLLWYSVHVERDKTERPLAVQVRIRAQDETGETYPFTLVHNEDRFPLHENDGQALPMTPHGDSRGTPGHRFRPSAVWPRWESSVFWSARVTGLHGYLRLFVCLPPDLRSTVALSDPPIGHLYLAPQVAR